MSLIPPSVKCNGCGKNRIEDTNHWVTFYFNAYQIGGNYELIVHPGVGVIEDSLHACGQECASKLFARWFAEGKL